VDHFRYADFMSTYLLGGSSTPLLCEFAYQPGARYPPVANGGLTMRSL
jgi:hypothetical protein